MIRTVPFRHVLAGIAGLAIAASASAQEFPTKPLRMLISYPAATGPDLIGRPIAAAMGKALGQPVVVENKSGGGGVPAIQDLKNSAADGHTMFLADQSHWAILPSVQDNVPYDPIRDFAPVGMIYSNVLFYVVPAGSSIKTLKDVIAASKANPGSIRYGVTGVGGIMHLTGEAFAFAAGIKMTVVPFRATAEAIQAILSGDLDMAVAGMNPVVAGALQTGKIRNIATTGPTRDKYMSDIPTVNESAGIGGYNYQADIGLLALTGTPRPAMEKLVKALAAAQKDSAYHDALKKLEYNATSMSPEEFGAKIKADLEKFRAVAKAGNIKVQ